MKKTKQNKRIREGDKVIVVAGNEKGRTGKVLSRTESRIVIQGLNVRKKHVKKSQENPQGGILNIEAPMHISNVQLCSESEKPVRLKARSSDTAGKEFYYVESGNEVVYRSTKNKQ